jgi:proliferating cell nuclear antigen
MFEACLEEAGLFKKIVEAIKDMSKDIKFDCAPTGISVQAMDTAHVCLISLCIQAGEGSGAFSTYRCDQ